MRVALALAVLTCALGGCGPNGPRPVVTVEPPTVAQNGWQAIVTPDDERALAELPLRWGAALDAVPRRARALVAAEGALVDPDAALELPAPPPGPYRCRLVRFGGRAGFRTFAPDFCYVDGDRERLSFTKQTGSNLPSGWLHPDTPTRLVFLGARPLEGEAEAPLYAADPAQDMSGVVERVSPFRWRLVMTRPGRGAVLDLYELVPVTPAVPGATPAVPAKE